MPDAISPTLPPSSTLHRLPLNPPFSLMHPFQFLACCLLLVPTGGDTSGDHVDIMGNRDMISDVLHISAGHQLSDAFTSGIRRMSAQVLLPSSIR